MSYLVIANRGGAGHTLACPSGRAFSGQVRSGQASAVQTLAGQAESRQAGHVLASLSWASSCDACRSAPWCVAAGKPDHDNFQRNKSRRSVLILVVAGGPSLILSIHGMSRQVRAGLGRRSRSCSTETSPFEARCGRHTQSNQGGSSLDRLWFVALSRVVAGTSNCVIAGRGWSEHIGPSHCLAVKAFLAMPLQERSKNGQGWSPLTFT